jgi:tetratricopeptide (TPR) repeat protein
LLELGIIICVTIVLILVLRNYSKTGNESIYIAKDNSTKGINMNFLKKILSKRREKAEKGIEEAIISGQRDIISPKEIEDAQATYFVEDPEVAQMLHESDDAFRAGDLKLAEEKAIDAIGKDKKCDQAYVFVGKVALLKQNYEEAKEAATTALKCNADNGFAYAILGEIYYKDEKYTDAIENFQKAVNYDRNNAEWQAGLGKAYMEVRQFAKAAKALKRAASLDIDNLEYKKLAMEAEEKQRAHSQAYRGV